MSIFYIASGEPDQGLIAVLGDMLEVDMGGEAVSPKNQPQSDIALNLSGPSK